MITNTNNLDKYQLKKLLEYNGIKIVKDHGNYYQITCPNCKEAEAFIEYSGEKRWIQCNRQNNCSKDGKAYNKKIWNFIAEAQGLEENDNAKIVQYINETLEKPDLENDIIPKEEIATLEITKEDLKFLQYCEEIFKQNINQNSETANFVKKYLQQERGYNEEIIQKFEIGLLPSEQDLTRILIDQYNYNQEQARHHINKLLGVTKHNDNTTNEFAKNNITIAWKDTYGNVQGFSLRKPTSKKVANKYMSSKGLQKSKLFFNLNRYDLETNKKAVIVEGQFDALSATYCSNENIQKQYHFIASGGKTVSKDQAILVRNHGIKEIILLRDNDEAGEDYTTSLKNLVEQGIEVYVARQDEKSEFKDIDEMLRDNPDQNDLAEVLEKITLEGQMGNKQDDALESKKNEVIRDIETCFSRREEIDTYNLQKIQIEKQNQDIENSLRNALASNDIPNIIKYSQQYNEKVYGDLIYDQPYSPADYKKDMTNKIEGYKTGFKELDNFIAIEPGTLTIVAGRPSHGKTTMMLNMYRNMISANEDKSFLFYSYEEHRQDIINKIIISLARLEYMTNERFEKLRGRDEIKNKDKNVLVDELLPQQTYWQALKYQINNYFKNVQPENPTPITFAISKVIEWMEEGRLCVMGKKSSVEKLNIALIDKAVEYMDSNKFRPLGGAYIDYTQKLNTEENRTNRQQEIQRICEILLNTTLNKRFHSPLILGAQVNRMVYSLATLTADKMREGGDIEQDANLILGIWDIQQSQQEQILLLLEEYEKKKLKNTAENKSEELLKVNEAISNLEEKLKETKNHDSETKTIKILKSRNGSKCQADLQSYSSEFLLQEKPEINTGDETFE